MVKIGYFILIAILLSLKVDACRFTVREIGFSILSQDIYTLVVIDKDANPNDTLWKQYRKKSRSCNLRLEVLDPITDSEHPVILKTKKDGIQFPAAVLVSPTQEMITFSEYDLPKIYAEITNSPMRQQLITEFPEVFAVVLWIEGKDIKKNQLIKSKIQEECESITNLMPTMPKIVKRGPIFYPISATDFEKERLLLWSLGFDSAPEEPMALVLYGRGRMMGGALNYEQVIDGGLYKYMSMIGADCECGLDRKWMLGNQIPLMWEPTTRQGLTKLLSFDVDNPMILAEMSRILAKEKVEDATGSVAFAPESIDLDEFFGESVPENDVKENLSSSNISMESLVYTLISLLVVIFAIAGYLAYRKM